MKDCQARNNLYHVFFKLEQLQTLIVGGGNVGMEKLEYLLRNSPGAPITLVGANIDPRIKEIQHQFPNLRLIERKFRAFANGFPQ
jgi:siroheme synthase (precorrin-2 oxidase/ferrochelatase)